VCEYMYTYLWVNPIGLTRYQIQVCIHILTHTRVNPIPKARRSTPNPYTYLLSIYLPINLCIHLSIHPSICLSMYLYRMIVSYRLCSAAASAAPRAEYLYLSTKSIYRLPIFLIWIFISISIYTDGYILRESIQELIAPRAEYLYLSTIYTYIVDLSYLDVYIYIYIQIDRSKESYIER